MRKIDFDNLYDPEYYMEIEGYEARLGVLKLNDLLKTLGEAALSLIYSDKNEQPNIENKLELGFVRRFHIRHAIIDLNNSYDILLQVPWFFYRVWEFFNSGGPYYEPKNRHKDIIRHRNNWVHRAEKACNYERLHTFLSNHHDPKLKELAREIECFQNKFIFNRNKEFTIRSITNHMKHNGALKIEELRQTWDFNLKLNGEIINLKDNNLELASTVRFNNTENGCEGLMKIQYTDDLYIDIEYLNGEKFFGKDYVIEDRYYSFEELHQEGMDYYNNLVDLYEKLFQIVSTNLHYNPLLNIDGIRKSSDTVNLDKYFTLRENA
jgi:hypothetical protein